MGKLSESLWYSWTTVVDLDHKMMKKRKWGVRRTGRGRGMGWAIQRLGGGNKIVGGSKGIAIK